MTPERPRTLLTSLNLPQWFCGKVAHAFNDYGKAIKDCLILVVGQAYNKNVDDTHESPAGETMSLLQAKGSPIIHSNPNRLLFPQKRNYMFALALSTARFSCQDCILQVTDHARFDYPMPQTHAWLIVDMNVPVTARGQSGG